MTADLFLRSHLFLLFLSVLGRIPTLFSYCSYYPLLGRNSRNSRNTHTRVRTYGVPTFSDEWEHVGTQGAEP